MSDTQAAAPATPEAPECPGCKGSGTVRVMTSHLGPDDYEFDEECVACAGTGSADIRDAVNALPYSEQEVPGTKLRRANVDRAKVLRIIEARAALAAPAEGLQAVAPTPADLASQDYWRGYAAGVKAPHTEAAPTAPDKAEAVPSPGDFYLLPYAGPRHRLLIRAVRFDDLSGHWWVINCEGHESRALLSSCHRLTDKEAADLLLKALATPAPDLAAELQECREALLDARDALAACKNAFKSGIFFRREAFVAASHVVDEAIEAAESALRRKGGAA